MNPLRKLYLLLKEIGAADLAHYASYQARLRSGAFLRLTPPGEKAPSGATGAVTKWPDLPWHHNWKRLPGVTPSPLMLTEAQLVQEGRFSPFFGAPQGLDFTSLLQSDIHWTKVNPDAYDDIKFVWEPARFIWSLSLASSYQQAKDDNLADLFWGYFSEFTRANTANCGPNWVSAQEVGLRAIMLLLTMSAFSSSSRMTPECITQFNASLIDHVRRVIPTLGYARSQHNNHILSESLFLVFAGDFFDGVDPRAREWVQIGEREFTHAIVQQIEDSGIYSQHSANYHRMMLQLALLYDAHTRFYGKEIPIKMKSKLAAATEWLIAQLDPASGRLPNLGHNDGTLLLPFGCAEFRDYRPTAQAAARGFLGHSCLPSGAWDELAIWLGLGDNQQTRPLAEFSSAAVHKVGLGSSWGSLRAVRFLNRPAHADQLHVDLWWQGANIARDAGTYAYNLPAPWQNALDRTAVHNTLMVNDLDQMARVSRFLWLDQAQAIWKDTPDRHRVSAAHNGYQHLGVTHQRGLEYLPGTGFIVIDTLRRETAGKELAYRLQWLLPDWAWQLSGEALILKGPEFSLQIEIAANEQPNLNPLPPVDVSLVRAGKTLSGQRHDELLGWESNTYGEKRPALSFSLKYLSTDSIEIITKWVVNESIN